MPVVIDGTLGVTTPYGYMTNAITENATTIASNYTISNNYNGLSAGPVTINTGVTVTIPTGSAWAIV